MSTCEFLTWDSSFFGRRIARLRGQLHSEADLKNALLWCREQEIDCLYALIDADEIGTRRDLEEAGFRLQDIRITLKYVFGIQNLQATQDEMFMREAAPADLAQLEQIAASSYRLTRFYNDPNFGSEQASDLYRTWIRNSLAGYADLVRVAEVDGAAAGFITCHIDHEQSSGRIGLVGVAENARGSGIGSTLVRDALLWFRQHQLVSVQVVTQGANLPALRLYERAGFSIRSVSLWYHRWFTNDSPREAAVERI
ncbi:MAG: GNAT family N-acetyltransferase [Anaerolineales bacterium]